MHELDSIRPFWLDLYRAFSQPVLLAPLIALAVAAVGRVVLRGALAPAGTALALVAGWLPLFGPLRVWANIWSPRMPAEALMLATLGVTAAVMAMDSAMRQQAAVVLGVLAVVAAWWLSGAHGFAAVIDGQVVRIAFLAVVLWAGMRAMTRAAPWAALVAALALGLALLAADDGGPWPMLGFVVAAVALAQMVGTPGAGAMLPAGLGLGGVAALAALVTGRLPHGGIGAPDIAGAAPLVTLWLPGPLKRLGPRFGPLVAGALMVFATFIVRRLLVG